MDGYYIAQTVSEAAADFRAARERQSDVRAAGAATNAADGKK